MLPSCASKQKNMSLQHRLTAPVSHTLLTGACALVIFYIKIRMETLIFTKFLSFFLWFYFAIVFSALRFFSFVRVQQKNVTVLLYMMPYDTDSSINVTQFYWFVCQLVWGEVTLCTVQLLIIFIVDDTAGYFVHQLTSCLV